MEYYNDKLKNIYKKIEIIKEKTKEYKELEKIEGELKITLEVKKSEIELEKSSKGMKL